MTELVGVDRGAVPRTARSRSGAAAFARGLLAQPKGRIGLVITLGIVLAAIGAPLLTHYDPSAQALLDALLPPSSDHLFGTDEFGRDVLSRTLFGARASLQVAFFAVGLSTLVGTAVGLLAGYYGGRLDELLMRITDALVAFPALMLALIINAMLGSSLNNAIVAIAVVTTPGFARLARGSTLAVREREFVQAARALGSRDLRLLLRHILPNVAGPLIVNASNQLSGAIITEGSLSFLGLGVQPPTPSWGSMLRTAYSYIDTNPWLALAPGAAIVLAVLGFNFLGDALRDLLDPRLNER